MRISKFTLPAVTVAGALALAGCGGGDSMEDMDMSNNENGNENGGDAELSLLSLPGGGSYKTTDHATGNIEAGEGINVGSGIRVNCPEAAGDAGCDYQITEDGIYAAGNAEAVAPPARIVGGADGDSSEDTHPLSHKNLLAALISESGDRGTLYGANVPDDVSPTSNNGIIFQRSDGYNTRLILSATPGTSRTDESDYVYYGHWSEWLRGTDEQKGKRNVVWGGSMPYGKVPAKTIDTATYGTATDANAEIYYKIGTGDWIRDTAAVQLMAHFDNGRVIGTVSGNEDGPDDLIAGAGTTGPTNTGDDIPAIDLNSALITASGFSGTTGFQSGGTGGGTWKGAFYGPSEGAASTTDGTPPSPAPRPSHAAGEFNAARGSGAASIDVRGAFGVEDPAS